MATQIQWILMVLNYRITQIFGLSCVSKFGVSKTKLLPVGFLIAR